jgi:hypothetical protein
LAGPDRSDALKTAINSSIVRVIPGQYTIGQLQPGVAVPHGALLTFNDEIETTVVYRTDLWPPELSTKKSRGPYSVIRLVLSQPFVVVGFIAAVTKAVSAAGINQLSFATYSFDYIFVQSQDLVAALKGLQAAGFTVATEDVL